MDVEVAVQSPIPVESPTPPVAPPVGKATTLPAKVLLPAIADQPVPPRELTPEQRSHVFGNDWTAVGNVMKVRLIQSTSNENVRRIIQAGNFSNIDSAIAFFNDHPELAGDRASTLSGLLQPGEFNPQDRRALFLEFAKSQGAITGEMINAATKDRLQIKLTELSQNIGRLPQDHQEQIMNVLQPFNAVVNSGVVDPQALTQLVQGVKSLYDLDRGAVTDFLTRNNVSAANNSVQSLLNNIEQYSQGTLGLFTATEPLKVDELLSGFSNLVTELDTAEMSVEQIASRMGKLKLAGGIGAALLVLVMMQGFGGINSTEPSSGQ